MKPSSPACLSHLTLLLVLGFTLSGCCHGQWCLGAVGKDPQVPPSTNVDDRTHGGDPRVRTPHFDPVGSPNDHEHDVLTK